MKHRLNPYQIMWIVVAYDFPMREREDQREYTRFRKFLSELGFTQIQYSIYARHCPGMPHVFKYKRRIRKYPLKKGHLMIMVFTDKQFGMIDHVYGTGYYTQRGQKRISMPTLFSFLEEDS